MTSASHPWAVPTSWTWTTIGTVVESSFYGPRFAKEQYVKSGIPTIRTTDMTPSGEIVLREPPEVRVSPDELERFELKDGDLLVTRTGSIGRCAVYRTSIGPALPSAYLIRFRLHQQRCEPEYLVRYLLAPFGQTSLGASATAVTQPNVNAQAIGAVQLALPPISEQRRIVAKLEAIQARSRRARDALDAVPPLLEKLRQSILAAAFRGDLTKDWRAKNKDVEPASKLLDRIRAERRKKWEESELAKLKAKGKPPTDDKWKSKYKEPAPVDTTGLPGLPEGWCWASVEELSTKVVDGVHKKPTYVAAGIPFLTVKNLTAGAGISFAEVNYITPADHEEYIKRTDPEQGDILISKDGTLGITRLIETDAVFSIFVSLALVKPVMRGMGKFLELAFWSPVFQERFKATGSGLLHIHLVDLRAAALPLAPAAEQSAIDARAREMLQLVAALEASHLAANDGLKTLDRSILGTAFRGELVPQTPRETVEATRVPDPPRSSMTVTVAPKAERHPNRAPRAVNGPSQAPKRPT